MRFLITGASGLVGSAFARLAAGRGHEVIGVVGSYPEGVPGLARQHSLNLEDGAGVARLIEAATPEAVINCAAMSSPADCEQFPEISDRLNVRLPESLAGAAARTGATLIHLSSEQVFSGEGGRPYAVTDPPAPINRYGRQKLESERVVLSIAALHAVVVRPPLMIGNSLSANRALHEHWLLAWSQQRAPTLYSDEYRQPCTADNLAAAILELAARSDLRGLFHWAGTDLISRHDLAIQIRGHFGLPPEAAPVKATVHAANPEVSRLRPRCLPIDPRPLSERLAVKPQPLSEQYPVLRPPPALAPWLRAHSRYADRW